MINTKRIVFFIILIFAFFILGKTTLAVPMNEVPIGVDLTAQDGQNPAPPIGLTTCGKTMCNKDEVCMKYPMEPWQHCVPKDKIPLPQPQPLEQVPDIEFCNEGTGVFPPNSTCINNFKNAIKDIGIYERTCIYEPIAEYTDDRQVGEADNFETQGYKACGMGDAGPDPNAPEPPADVDSIKCAVSMLVYTDVRDADLGSYGPSTEVRQEETIDFVAQNYLYDALFGKSMDLTNSEENLENNRESSRTYWRLLSAGTQANLRSFTLNMANEDQINNISFNYKDTNGVEKKTDFKSLYSALNKQVIIFPYFPFVRIGCLTDYPVCPQYAQAISELKPPGQNITDFLKIQAENSNVFIDAVTQAAINLYSLAISPFSNDLDGPYAAFVPLNFDSAKGYILKKKDDFEEEFYSQQPGYYINKLKDIHNKPRLGTDKPSLTNVSSENLPYINAIYQGILSPKFGILSALHPSWLIEKYATPEAGIISDYKLGNKSEDFPEVKIYHENYIDFLTKELEAFSIFNPTSFITAPASIVGGTISWIYEEVKDFFQKDENLKGYKPDDEDLTVEEATNAYMNYKNCPVPLSYHILSPKTKPVGMNHNDNMADHHQVITIMGEDVKWTFAPKCAPIQPIECSKEELENNTCEPGIPPNACPNTEQQFREGDSCCSREWKVYGVRHGKALTVANNPKQTDIKNAIVQNKQFSLNDTLLPDAVNNKRVFDAGVDAPYALNYSSYLSAGRTSTAPRGKTTVVNEVEPIHRINNRAQDTVHLLQNCWTVPDGLQNSPRCELELTEATANNLCTGEAFEKITGIKEAPEPGAEAKRLFGIVGELSDDIVKAYAEAEKVTGIPCEVLAGIHYREGGNKPDQDLQSGAPLAGRSLVESAIQAGEELRAKAGGDINDIDTLIKALSWYNGGGNANCQAENSFDCPYTTNGRCGSIPACSLLPADASSNAIAAACTCSGGKTIPGSCRDLCGSGTFPFKIPTSPGLCPAKSIGYDDPYSVELWQPMHENMFVLYKYDCTATAPENQDRLGTFTFALQMYLNNKETSSAAPSTTDTTSEE